MVLSKTTPFDSGWLWYLGTLVPVSGIVQVGSQASADRYTYIPLIGVFIAVVFPLHDWVSRSKHGNQIPRLAYPLALVLLVTVSYAETSHWRNSQTLSARGIEVRSDNYIAHGMLGNVYREKGDMRAAEEHYRRYLSFIPDDYGTRINLAYVLQSQKRWVEARDTLVGCTEIDSDRADAYFNLGILMVESGNVSGAQEWYQKALERETSNPDIHINFGNVLARLGDFEGALGQYDAAITLNPTDAVAHLSRGGALFSLNRFEDASESVQECLRLTPNNPSARSLNAAIQQRMRN